MSVPMNCGDAIVQSLLQHGVDTVFGLPGVHTYPFFDALYRAGDAVRVITPRHEQTTAYMAFGYAKSTGKVGVYSVVPGPGMLNTSAALCSAYGASAPVFCVTGQVPSDYIGSGKGHVHELPDQLATLRLLTKWAARIDHPAEAPGLVAEAIRQALSGRPRPVALEVPWDILTQKAPLEIIAPLGKYPDIESDPDEITKAVNILKDAKNPMIMVGGGAVDASAEVLALAEMLQAPVASYRSGRGIVSDEHYLGFNCASGMKRWPETDVLIGIGSRLQLIWFGWQARPNVKTILIDIDPQQRARLKPDVGIVGDAKTSVQALTAALDRVSSPRASRREEFEAIKQRTLCEIQKVKPHVQFLEVIRQVLPRDGFLVEEICQAGFTSLFAFPVYAPRTFVTCGHQATLGFGFPTALGVKVANPNKAVVSLAGDGGFQFGIQELATAAQYGINLVVIVYNNGAYFNVMRDQQERFNGRLQSSLLRNPDFLKVAEGFGVRGYKAATPVALKAALENALSESAPALIEVPIELGTEGSPWEFLQAPPPRK